MNKLPCAGCVNYIQALRQQPDQTFRAVSHGVCAAQSEFRESDTDPAIPPSATRVPNEALPKKVTVQKGATVASCTRAIRRDG